TNTVGSSAGRNLGASLSQADLVAYTDDDCIVSGSWLEALVAEFQDVRVAAVYGRLLPYEGDNKRTGSEVGFKAALQRAEYSERTPPWYIGHGGNMAFRRVDLREAGGFDPLPGAGGLYRVYEHPAPAIRLLVNGKQAVNHP